jgi:hypothetical protein
MSHAPFLGCDDPVRSLALGRSLSYESPRRLSSSLSSDSTHVSPYTAAPSIAHPPAQPYAAQQTALQAAPQALAMPPLP